MTLKEITFFKMIHSAHKTLDLCFGNVAKYDKSWVAFHVFHFSINGCFTVSFSMEKSASQHIEIMAWNRYDIDCFDKPFVVYDWQAYRAAIKLIIKHILKYS